MKAGRHYSEYLRDILDAAQKAERFTSGVTFEVFAADDEKTYAVSVQPSPRV
jgi:uncharacterized protein with HEPN domain